MLRTMRGRGASRLLLPLLLLLATPRRGRTMNGAAEQGGGGIIQHGIPKLERLPLCSTTLGSISQQAADELRDALQSKQLNQRIARELELFIMYKRNPPSDIKEQYAFNTTIPLEELEKRKASAEATISTMHSKVQEMMAALSGKGVLGANANPDWVQSCVMGRLNAHNFPYRPVVSFMLQYEKRPWMIDPIVGALQKCQEVAPSELVVNVDSLSEHAVWANLSYSTKGFVVPIFSARIHETRGYNRLSELARGKFLVALKDDETPPEDCSWLQRLLTLFERWHHLGAVGMGGYAYSFQEGATSGGVNFKDTTANIPMQFVQAVEYAPVAFRKAALKHVGGLDEGLSQPGECGVTSDVEVSTRLWLAGWQVAHMQVEGRKPDDAAPAGTPPRPVNGAECWKRRRELADNGNPYWKRWEMQDQPVVKALAAHVRALNFKELQYTGTTCPFSQAMGGCPA